MPSNGGLNKQSREYFISERLGCIRFPGVSAKPDERDMIRHDRMQEHRLHMLYSRRLP